MKRHHVPIRMGILLSLVGLSCSQEEPVDSLEALRRGTLRPSILLITVDTLRADRLSSYGRMNARTPSLDRIARGGISFQRAISPAPLTVPAHASLLTGNYPFQTGVRTNEARLQDPEGGTLATRLREGAGYESVAFLGSAVLERAHGLDVGFSVYEDQMGRGRVERTAGEVVDLFLAWLGSRAEKRPFFAWVHLYDPHVPFSAPEPFGERVADPYDAEIAYSDHQVGRLVRAVGESSSRPVVTVLTSDHGESLGEHGEDTHGIFIYDATVHIPLVFHAPGLLAEGRVISEQVRLVDVFPTLLRAAGAVIPDGLAGEDLLDVLIGDSSPRELPAYIESYYAYRVFGYHPIVGLTAGRWKTIQSPVMELYDLDRDPMELENDAPGNSSRMGEMQDQLERLMRRLGQGESVAATIPPERQRQLLSLGYLVGINHETESGLPTAGLEDVKTIVPFLQEFDRIAKLVEKRDPSFPDEISSLLTRYKPRSPYVYRSVLGLLQPFSDQRAAAKVLELLCEVEPNDVEAHAELGEIYYGIGSYRKSFDVFSEVLGRDADNLSALIGLGFLNLSLTGDRVRAREHLERFLEVAPRTDARIALVQERLSQLQ